MQSCSVAKVISFFVKEYTQPLLVLGSTRVRMSSIGIVWIFWGSGYLNEFDGPCGCRNVSFTSLVSLQTSSTQANHQFFSCKQVTNPAFDSGGISFFARATLSFLELLESYSNGTLGQHLAKRKSNFPKNLQ